jgi:hypothetical protein
MWPKALVALEVGNVNLLSERTKVPRKLPAIASKISRAHTGLDAVPVLLRYSDFCGQQCSADEEVFAFTANTPLCKE